MRKTNAVRSLELHEISFRREAYSVDPADLSATSVAEEIGVSPRRLMKTLVVVGPAQHYFAVLPADSELDLRALGKLVGEKRLSMAPQRDLQTLTGYLRGGVTPLCARRPQFVLVDQAILEHDEVSISAGIRGQQLLLAPSHLLRALELQGSRVTLGEISKKKTQIRGLSSNRPETYTKGRLEPL